MNKQLFNNNKNSFCSLKVMAYIKYSSGKYYSLLAKNCTIETSVGMWDKERKRNVCVQFARFFATFFWLAYSRFVSTVDRPIQ